MKRRNDMEERLTDSEVSKSFTEQELKTSEQARIYQKLGEIEDILEENGIDEEELEEKNQMKIKPNSQFRNLKK